MTNYLRELGGNLRRARKRRFPKDDLAAFALRIGVSRSTLQKMEKGDLTVALGEVLPGGGNPRSGRYVRHLVAPRGKPVR